MNNLVKRADKKAFWGLVSDQTTTYTRMKGFTSISGSKNPKEYSRQYVDEAFEQTDVTGYSPSWELAFDEYLGDSVQEDIISILDGEKTGADAVREVVFVDFSSPPSEGKYPAVKRMFSVIGGSEGDGTDAYTYGCTLKCKSSIVKGEATIATPETDATPENSETITFTVPT